MDALSNPPNLNSPKLQPESSEKQQKRGGSSLGWQQCWRRGDTWDKPEPRGSLPVGHGGPRGAEPSLLPPWTRGERLTRLNTSGCISWIYLPCLWSCILSSHCCQGTTGLGAGTVGAGLSPAEEQPSALSHFPVLPWGSGWAVVLGAEPPQLQHRPGCPRQPVPHAPALPLLPSPTRSRRRCPLLTPSCRRTPSTR